jgi:phosphomannomutase
MSTLPKALVFDLDGTLSESKQPMDADMGLLLSGVLAHIPIAIMSGAGFPQFQTQFFPALPLQTPLDRLYIFPDNAAQCFVHRQGGWRAQYDQAFSGTERAHLLQALNAALDEVGLREAPVRVWGERIEDRGAEIAFSPLGQGAPLPDKQAWHDAHEDLRRRLHELLNKKLPDFANAMGGLTTIDITRKGINKAYGVRRFSELARVDIEQMLYVGDALGEGGNDAVVVESGIPTHAVFGPEETAALLRELLRQFASGNNKKLLS